MEITRDTQMLLKRETPSCVLMCVFSVACFAHAHAKDGQISIGLSTLNKIIVKYLRRHENFIEIHLVHGGVSVFIRNELWHELSSQAVMYRPKDKEQSLVHARKKDTCRGVAPVDDIIHALEAAQAHGTITGQYKLTFLFTRGNVRKLFSSIDSELITHH